MDAQDLHAKDDARPRVLFVDDDEWVQRALARAFGRAFRLSVAPSGEAALEALRAAPFDVVVVDYLMPGMTGVELIHRLQEEHPGLPRIMLTGHGELPELLALKRRDLVSAVLMKPWEQLDVEHAVRVALQGRA